MSWIIKIILFQLAVLSILTAFLTFLLGIGTATIFADDVLHIWSNCLFSAKKKLPSE